jgi:hypothetical protein
VKRGSGKSMITTPTPERYWPLRIANPSVCGRAISARLNSLDRRGVPFRRVDRFERRTSTMLNHAPEHITVHRSPRLSRASCADLQRRGSVHYGFRRVLALSKCSRGVQNVLTLY